MGTARPGTKVTKVDGIKGKWPSIFKCNICWSLLETTKAYLVNTMRMPAAQTLLLFCHELHSNHDLTRIACDSWLELKFPVAEAAQTLVKKAIKARSDWEKLLSIRFEDGEGESLERGLTQQLVDLTNAQIVYSVRRLLAADVKHMFAGAGANAAAGPNPFAAGAEPLAANRHLGGVLLTPYFTYNCLNDDDDCVLPETWTCEVCGLVAALNFLEKQQHLLSCQPASQADSVNEGDIPVRKANSVEYECTKCQKTYYLTPVEILKHKKSHNK